MAGNPLTPGLTPSGSMESDGGSDVAVLPRVVTRLMTGTQDWVFGVRIGAVERDAEHLLRFAAAHRLISDSHAAAVLQDADLTVIGRLVQAGLLSRVRLSCAAECFVITQAGLVAIGSLLPPPVWEMRGLRRSLAAASVWVRVQDGRFSDLTGVVSQREMLAHDLELDAGLPATGPTRPYGLRLGGQRPSGGVGLHHPDVLCEFRAGWVAVEIVVGGATPRGLAALLTAYGVDDRFDRVVLLAETERVLQEIEAAATTAGVASVASVQRLEFSER
jgi:hypothetical protein